MVRKWSYIENRKTCYKISPRFDMKRLSRKHSFKVFRKTTRFKKYRLGITRSVRKFYVRKRRRTSIYMNSHIVYSWIHQYLKHRQFIRFTQSYGLVCMNGYLGNADFSLKNSLIVGADYGFHSYSCSTRVLNKSVFFKNSIFTDRIQSFESRNSFVQFVDHEASCDSNDLGTNTLFFDKMCYPFDSEEFSTKAQTDFLTELDSTVFTTSLCIVTEFNITMNLLTLLSIKNQ